MEKWDLLKLFQEWWRKNFCSKCHNFFLFCHFYIHSHVYTLFAPSLHSPTPLTLACNFILLFCYNKIFMESRFFYKQDCVFWKLRILTSSFPIWMPFLSYSFLTHKVGLPVSFWIEVGKTKPVCLVSDLRG
jgi:hypothetical protein